MLFVTCTSAKKKQELSRTILKQKDAVENSRRFRTSRCQPINIPRRSQPNSSRRAQTTQRTAFRRSPLVPLRRAFVRDTYPHANKIFSYLHQRLPVVYIYTTMILMVTTTWRMTRTLMTNFGSTTSLVLIFFYSN